MPSTLLPRTGIKSPSNGQDPWYADMAFTLQRLDDAFPVWVSNSTGVAGDDNGSVLNADYGVVKAAGGGVLFVRPGVHKHAVDLLWDSNLVSVIGPGSGICTFQAVGTAKIIARPSVFTVTQGPRFAGFTVKGDPSFPAGAKGIYSGDIVGSDWDDIVFSGFAGTNSIELHLDNVVGWTEQNRFRRVRFENGTVNVRCSHSAGSSNSFARNHWDIDLNPNGGQIGFQTTNDALLYGQTGHFDGNSAGNGAVFVDVAGGSISGHIDMDFESSGTGTVGVRESGGVFLCNGIRNYAGTMAEDVGGGVDLLNLPGGLRIKELLANSRQGAAALVAGAVTVNTSAVKAGSAGQRIHLTRQLGAGTRGFLEIGTRTPGVSFVINSLAAAGGLAADTSVVAWRIDESY
jgi:hypothetical protein